MCLIYVNTGTCSGGMGGERSHGARTATTPVVSARNNHAYITFVWTMTEGHGTIIFSVEMKKETFGPGFGVLFLNASGLVDDDA